MTMKKPLLLTIITLSLTIANMQLFAQSFDWAWAKSAGGTSSESGKSVSTDLFGNVYLTGRFNSDSVTFGSFTLENAGLSGDIYLVKYDSNGDVLWARSVGGTNI